MPADALPVPAPPQPSLFLRRPHLDRLAPLDVAPGYTLRVAVDEDADVDAVGHVLGAAFPDMDWSPPKTRERLFDDTTVKTVFLVTNADGDPAATASARIDPARPSSGYVHWVGALPAHQGKGLGRLATLATLHEFARLGLADAVLETDDFRIPALRVYGRLGFRPETGHPSHAPRWAAILAAHPELKPFLEMTD